MQDQQNHQNNRNALEIDPVFNSPSKLIMAVNLPCEALVVRISPDKEFCAVGLSCGSIKLVPIGLKSNENSIDINVNEDLPCTDLCFMQKGNEKLRIIATYASGYLRILQYTRPSNKISILRFWRETESDLSIEDAKEPSFNQILCCALSLDGKRIVTGGADTIVRLYEIRTSTIGKPLVPNIRMDKTVAHNFHTNRVTALSYHPRGIRDVIYLHMFVSASWDGTIQGWDDRSSGSLWQYAGSAVAGADGLCIDPIRNLIITGCYNHDKILSQIWEARISVNPERRKSLTSMAVPLSIINQEAGAPATQIYVSRLSADGQHVIFGGTNVNLLKLVNATTMRTLTTVTSLVNGVYSADSCLDPDDRKRLLVVFTNGNRVYVASFDLRPAATADLP